MTAKKGCCDWVASLFKKVETPQKLAVKKQEIPNNNNSPEINSELEPESDNHNSQSHQNVNNHNVEPEPILVENKPQFLTPIINTKFEEKDIIVNDVPIKSQGIKYNCPICLRYFNHILTLNCCKNYLCLLCILSFIETANKYLKPIKCLICNYSEILKLDDVDPSTEIRYYSDSIYASLKKTAQKDKNMIKQIIEESIKKSKVKRFIENIEKHRNSFDEKMLKSLEVKRDEISEIKIKSSQSFKTRNKNLEFKIVLKSLSNREKSISATSKNKKNKGNSLYSDTMINGEFYFERDRESQNNLGEYLEKKQEDNDEVIIGEVKVNQILNNNVDLKNEKKAHTINIFNYGVIKNYEFEEDGSYGKIEIAKKINFNDF